MGEPQRLDNQVLVTKLLVPRVPRALVGRPRLAALLRAGLERKLTLVAAPAGFGKTTLLASWATSLATNEPPVTVAWVSLDPADSHPFRFWLHVLSAIERQLPGAAQAALAALRARPEAPPQDVLRLLVNTFAEAGPTCVLILDDYHAIADPAIHTALAFLLDYLPPRLHLVLVARALPPLPLARLRAGAALQELREEQLRCTPEEGVTFLTEVMGLALPTDALHSIATRTEGWLVGLQLIGLWLQQRPDMGQLPDEIRGSHRYILDYVTEQVLDQQPAAIRRFLLHTSVLDELSAELCAAVLNDDSADEAITTQVAQKILEALERANLFLTALDGQRRWYRYHALFAEALRAQLEHEDPALPTRLHLRASRWYAANQRRYEAIQHAMLAREWVWAADLAIDIMQLSYSRPGEATVILGWIGTLPINVLLARLELCKAYVRLLLWANENLAAERWLQHVAAALEQPADRTGQLSEQERTRLLGYVTACRALLAVMLDRTPQVPPLIAQAQALLDQTDGPERSGLLIAEGWLAYAHGEITTAIQHVRAALAVQQRDGQTNLALGTMATLGRFLQIQGHLQAAWELGRTMVDTTARTIGRGSAIAGFGYSVQARLLYEWNRLDEAHEQAQQAYTLAAVSGLEALQVLVSFRLVAIALTRSDWNTADALLREVSQLRSYEQNPLQWSYQLEAWQARLWIAQGDTARAAQWAAASGTSTTQALIIQNRLTTARARVALALNQPAEALHLLDRIHSVSRQQERLSHVIEQLVLLALAHYLRGDAAASAAALTEALELGAAEGYLRSFLDEGPALIELLRRLPASPARDRVLTAFGQEESVARKAQHASEPVLRAALERSNALVEPPTEREREVLQLLAQGATNQEIAAALVVAPSTVKNHLSRIFGKLAVSNRTQAVARARALGLLDDLPR